MLMNAQLSMFDLMTSPDTRNVISSPVSAVGLLPFSSPDGPQIVPPGPAPARASRSARPGKGKELRTSGIYGPTYTDSSARGVPMSSLESRFLERLGTLGSMEYVLTLHRKITPSKHSIFRLAASARPTSETGCTGWRSPNVREKGGGDYSDPAKAAARMESGHQVNLADEVMVMGWTSPQAHDSTPGDPNRVGRFGTAHGGRNLNDEAAQIAGWASPSARDHKDTPGMATEATNPDGSLRDRTDQLPRQVAIIAAAHQASGIASSSSDPTQKASTGASASKGALNPEFVAWLMSFPPEWLECAPEKKPKAKMIQLGKGNLLIVPPAK